MTTLRDLRAKAEAWIGTGVNVPIAAEHLCDLVQSVEELRAALVRAHDCATVRDDGECDGCPASAALASVDARFPREVNDVK